MHESIVLKGVFEATYRRQTCRETRGVQVHYLWKGLLLEEFSNDPHIHLPQIEAGGNGSNPVFLVTTWTELARRAAEFI